MRPYLVEDIPNKVTPIQQTTAWTAAAHEAAFPRQHATMAQGLPYPRFNEPAYIHAVRAQAKPDNDALQYNPRVLEGWNVSSSVQKSVPRPPVQMTYFA